MMCDIVERNGERMVVDPFSGRRFPPYEEALILGNLRIAEEEHAKAKAEQPQAKTKKTTIPTFLQKH